MLFGYPIEATEENWFHECIFEMLQTIHNNLLTGERIPNWPEIIPAVYVDRLRNRRGLKDRIDEYKVAAGNLSNNQIIQLKNLLIGQNDVFGLLNGNCNCETIENLPASIQIPTRKLFEFCFDLLSDLGIRDHQYGIIYKKIPSKVCPFCGCESFYSAEAPRQDLDHYLAESLYTFAGVNLRNLVPMGNICNERYKHGQDMLHRRDGTRRKAYNPYDHSQVSVSLEGSIPFEGKDGLYPRWNIEFSPNQEETRTWDEVFHIRDRYKRDILDQDFRTWLGQFYYWCRSANLRPTEIQNLLYALKNYAECMQMWGWADRAFLKAAVFRMFIAECEAGNNRLIDFLLDTANGVA